VTQAQLMPLAQYVLYFNSALRLGNNFKAAHHRPAIRPFEPTGTSLVKSKKKKEPAMATLR
jgi:hypothetical protein